jgi:hypothetical protein
MQPIAVLVFSLNKNTFRRELKTKKRKYFFIITIIAVFINLIIFSQKKSFWAN